MPCVCHCQLYTTQGRQKGPELPVLTQTSVSSAHIRAEETCRHLSSLSLKFIKTPRAGVSAAPAIPLFHQDLGGKTHVRFKAPRLRYDVLTVATALILPTWCF